MDGTSVSPEAATVRHSAFYLTTPDSMDVLAFGDRWGVFVTLSVSSDGPVPGPGDFALTVDGGRPGWMSDEVVRGEQLSSLGRPYTYETPTKGWVGFDAPAPADAADARVRVQFGGENEGALRWPLSEHVKTALARPAPDFAVTAFRAPDVVSLDDPIEVSVTVENRGDGPGTFCGVLN